MKTNSKKTKKKDATIIEQSLRTIPITKLSKESGFSKRKAKKIKPRDLLVGFFMMVFCPGKNSYKDWANKIGLLINGTVSKQALQKRMQPEQVIFLRKVLSYIIERKINQKLTKGTKEKLKGFKNVILEDSTHIKLSDKLWKEYPGNGYWDKEAKKAILKIQAAYNVVKNSFVRFEITSFRKNDQSYSEKIFEIVKKGDLVIRDLGYFVLKVFKEMDQGGIYFVSRMRKGVVILSKEEEKPIDLAKMLKKEGN